MVDADFMKRVTNLIVLAGLTITCSSAMAQRDDPSSRRAVNRVRLVLIPGSLDGGPEPQPILTLRLSNQGKTTLSFPQPGQLCADSMNGFVMVYKQILPPLHNDEIGSGCVIDRVARADVLSETKKWKTLAPGDVYEFSVPMDGMLLLNADARYQLMARYHPPHLTSSELSLLAANGIAVLQETIESPPIIVGPQKH